MAARTEVQKAHCRKLHEESALIPCACGCGTMIKEISKHGQKRRYISGHNGRLPPGVRAARQKEWKKRNKDRLWVAERLRLRRKKGELIILRGGQCKQCGVEYDGTNDAIFDFHHRIPEEKSFCVNVGGIKNYAFERALTEAKKCDIMCSNCHRMFHFEEKRKEWGLL